MKEKVFLVIPTIRTLDFLREWKDQFKDCHMIIIEDNLTTTVEAPKFPRLSLTHYCWNDIKKEFGKEEWIFPRKNSGIRTYGFWKAYQAGADVIITIDDDCFPAEADYVQKHLDNLNFRAPEAWFPTFPHPNHIYTRGFPYKVRNKYPAMISHGLWSNKMDLDAKTQIKTGNVNIPAYPSIRQFIPFGYFFPMSGMNLAFRREATPLMYFPLMGEDPQGKKWGYDRYDDIWAGLFAKKVCDHLGWAVVNGSPFVEHRKASDVYINLKKEKAGMILNELLWMDIIGKEMRSKNAPNSLKEVVMTTALSFKDPYLKNYRKAINAWTDLFN